MVIVEQKGLKKLGEIYSPENIKKALNHANTKTIAKVKTFLSKEARKKWHIKARDINTHAKVKKMYNGDNSKLLLYTGKRLSLMYFGATETRLQSTGRAITTKRTAKGGLFSTRTKGKASKNKRRQIGVKVKMQKGKGAEIVRGLKRFGGINDKNLGFLILGKRNNPQVFVRDGKERLKMRRLTGPSIPQMIGEKSILEKAFTFIEKEHQDQFAHHLDILEKGII